MHPCAEASLSDLQEAGLCRETAPPEPRNDMPEASDAAQAPFSFNINSDLHEKLCCSELPCRWCRRMMMMIWRMLLVLVSKSASKSIGPLAKVSQAELFQFFAEMMTGSLPADDGDMCSAEQDKPKRHYTRQAGLCLSDKETKAYTIFRGFFSRFLCLSLSLSLYILSGEALAGSKGQNRPNVQGKIETQRSRSSGLAGEGMGRRQQDWHCQSIAGRKL